MEYPRNRRPQIPLKLESGSGDPPACVLCHSSMRSVTIVPALQPSVFFCVLSGPLDLELQAVMSYLPWVLEMELSSSGRSAVLFHSYAVSCIGHLFFCSASHVKQSDRQMRSWGRKEFAQVP